MSIQSPLILGGGPAGSTTAIALAMAGERSVIFERNVETADAICGGFLSWSTIKNLERLGVEIHGHSIAHVRIFAGHHVAQSRLPAAAIGVSRLHLDRVMLDRAKANGVGVEISNVRNESELNADTLFLATGKHDVRGLARPKTDDADPALGLRVKIEPHPKLSSLIGPAIELFLFERGYAGLLLQEDGRANLCLVVRKSRLGEANGNAATLIQQWGNNCPALGERLAFAGSFSNVDAVGAIPYGWRAPGTVAGIFRVGDQAACIPSLAGEGIGIAVASGTAAADAWIRGGAAAAPAYQRAFSRRTRNPVGIAYWLWRGSETGWSARFGTRMITVAPQMARLFAKATRIDVEPVR